MHEQQLKKSEPLSQGQLEVTPEEAERLRQTAEAPKPTIGNILRLPFRYFRNKLHKPKAQSQILDENGVPVEWRHDPPETILRESQKPIWEAFEKWCEDRGDKSIPASAETVIEYLVSLESVKREGAYRAIADKHESIYWHTGACPHCELHVGYFFQIGPHGDMTIGILDDFYERFGLDDKIGIAELTT